MANRYQEDIKLIVGVEGSKTGNVPVHTAKDKIKGQRGIVYFNVDGSSSSTTGNTPGTDEDGTNQKGTTQPDAGSTDAGTSGGSSNAGNTLDATELAAPYPVDDATQSGSGILAVDRMTLGDVVNGLSGLIDCATGNPVDVRFDGQFTAPDGWEDAYSPPSDEYYSEGYYWVGNGWYGHSPSEVAEKYNSAVGGGLRFTYENNITDNVVIRSYWILNDNYQGFFSASRFSCGGDASDYCAPLDNSSSISEWPAEKPMQLSYNSETGQYETHPMDGNITTAYSQPVSQFSLCNSNGDSIKSFAQAGGGQAIYNETTGVATFMDASGKVTGYGDGASITNRQPR